MGFNNLKSQLVVTLGLSHTTRNRGILSEIFASLSFAKLGLIVFCLTGWLAIPQNASAAATSLTLSWQSVAAADGYKVERATASTGPWTQVGQTASNVTSYTNTGLTPGTTYYYRVRSFNEFGDSDPSVTVAGMTSPAAPTNLTASAASASQINLTWQNNTAGQTAVKVERATASSGPWSQIASVSGTTTSYSSTGLSSLTTYYYRVRAANAGGDSAYSTTANATTQAPPDTTAPSTPTGLVATGIATNQVRLTWNASTDSGGSGLAGYRVYRSGTLITSTTATTYTDSGRAAGTQYCYTIAAYDNAANSSTQTASACATTISLPPNAPSALTATAASTNQINLAWQNNSTGQTAVKVERATASTGPWTQIASLAGTATSYASTGLAAATRYYYRVRASNTGGDSAYSTTANAITAALPDTTAPTVPTGLTASGTATNQVHLLWNASADSGGSGLAGYRIYRNGVLVANTPSTSFIDSGRTAATEYCYRIVAYDNVGNNSAQSASVCATTLAAPAVVPLAGTYAGLVLHPTSPKHADSGTISVTVRADGSFSASVGLGGVRSSFSSRFTEAGTTSVSIPRTGLATLTVNLVIHNSHGEITGTVADGSRTVQVLAPRKFWSRALPCPWAGTYRLKFAPPEAGTSAIPEGYGYGTLLVRTDGSASFRGYLADGTMVLSSSFVSEDGYFPLYGLLYRRGGSSVSWLTLQPDGTATGVLDWFRGAATSGYYTNGFAASCEVTGVNVPTGLSTAADANGTSLELQFGGSEFPQGIVKQLWEDSRGRISVIPVGDRTVTLRLNRRTGEFYGTARKTATDPLLRYRGMLDITGATGAGFHLSPTRGGYLHFHATP